MVAAPSHYMGGGIAGIPAKGNSRQAILFGMKGKWVVELVPPTLGWSLLERGGGKGGRGARARRWHPPFSQTKECENTINLIFPYKLLGRSRCNAGRHTTPQH